MFTSVPSSNMAHIENELKQIEQDHHVEILFAVESGSRMWGFESPDSDYDVRFVYRSKEEAFYSSFERVGHPYKDTIQMMSDDRLYDYSGWDLPKFMRHLSAMNTSVVEWCHSPIVYLDTEVKHRTFRRRRTFQDHVKEYLRDFTQVKQLVKPYQGMLLSKKCCSLENVKRAMYSARILLVLDLVDRGIVPAAFTWDYLIAEASWTMQEKAALQDLRDRKMTSAEKHGEVPEEAKILLERKKEAVRLQVDSANATESVKDETREKQVNSFGHDKRTELAIIWEAFTK